MEDIEDRLNKLNEEDATLNYFYAAAGYLLSNVNGEASTLQKQTIVYRVGGKCWFPKEFISYVIENKNIEELYHDTIRLLVEMDEENKVVMMDFLLALAFVDGSITKKELDFIYDFGHEVGYSDDMVAAYIKELLPRNFRLNLTF
jgi:phosphotransferase system IIB component